MTKAQSKRDLNRAALEFARNVAAAINDKGRDPLVKVSPRNQETTGLGNIEIVDFDGELKEALWFETYIGPGGAYLVTRFNDKEQAVSALADASDFYALASEILEAL